MFSTLQTSGYSFLASLKKAIVYFFGIVFAVFLPIKALIIVIGCLIASDTAWGMAGAVRKKYWDGSAWITKGNTWEVKGLYSLTSKMFLYESLLLISFLFDKYVIGDIVAVALTAVPLFITKIVASVLGGIELYSIVKKIKSATGFDFVQRCKDALKVGKDIKSNVGDIIQSNEINQTTPEG